MGLGIFGILAAVAMVTNGQVDQGVCPVGGCTSDDIALMSAASSSANDHFYIAGLFGMHSQGDSPYTCGDWRLRGIINTEAFFWAIKEYSSLVENTADPVYVGGLALDTCTRQAKAVEGVYSFETCRTQYSNVEPRNVVAYVGPDTSDQALVTAHLLGEMNRTQISHAATTPALSDNMMYPFFLRTAISDDMEMKILVDFLQSYDISYVQVLYADNEFGRGMWQSFNKYVMETAMDMDLQVCVVNHAALTADTVSNMASALNENEVTKYVVVLADNAVARRVLERSDEVGLEGRYIYIGVSSWGNDPTVVDGLASAEKAITMSIASDEFYNQDAVTRFWTYFYNLKPDTGSNTGPNVNKHNPWFTQFWQDMFNCRIDLGTCDLNRDLQGMVPDSDVYVPFTLMAVDAVIRGVQQATQTYCGGAQLCSELLNREDDKLYLSIKSATYSGSNRFFGDSGDVSDTFHRYNLNQVKAGVLQKLLEVSYNSDTQMTSFQRVQGGFILELISTSCKDSPCTQCGDAPMTTPMVTQTTTESMMTTTPLDLEQALALLIDRYFDKDQEFTGVWRDQPRDSEDSETRFENGHDWIIAIGVCAGMGILCVLVFEVYILYKLMGTKIGKQWRTMWLGQLLLFGIFLCYLTLFAYLFTPTKATCGITRFGVGVSLSICFAILLVKLMVLLTSKTTADTLIPGDVDSPNYLRGIYQFLMFMFVVGVQVVIATMWLIMIPPDAVQVISNNGDRVWICNHYTWSIEAGKGWQNMTMFVRTEFENHIISLTYVMFLIVLTTIIAMKAHGIVTNHRESIFIGIASGFTIPIWVAWGLVGGLNKDHAYAQEFGDACIAFGLFITATLILFAMFLPKVRQLVNMGVEGIYLEDDRDTYYAGSVIMAPPSYKSRPGSSVVYVNNNGFNEPVIIGDQYAVHLKHPGSNYSAPVNVKRPESTAGGSAKVLKITADLTGKHPRDRKSTSEVGYAYAGSGYGTYRKAKSESGGTLRRSADLGAL